MLEVREMPKEKKELVPQEIIAGSLDQTPDACNSKTSALQNLETHLLLKQ